MKPIETPETRILRMTIWKESNLDQLNEVAALIRELPRVLRVRVNLEARQLEILFEHPTTGLLQEIHSRLRLVGSEMVAAKAY